MFPTGKEDPFLIFAEWFDEAKKVDIYEPTAVTLATADDKGRPSCRIVLLKEFDKRGFVYFTNKKSRKGNEVNKNSHAALCFYWDELRRQVRISGKVEEISEHESDAYFASRKRGSQIGAWASMQSQKLDKYSTLEKRVKEFEKEFGKGPIMRPPHWGGFRVVPKEIEFWQLIDHRLHKRILYERKGKKWESKLLYP